MRWLWPSASRHRQAGILSMPGPAAPHGADRSVLCQAGVQRRVLRGWEDRSGAKMLSWGLCGSIGKDRHQGVWGGAREPSPPGGQAPPWHIQLSWPQGLPDVQLYTLLLTDLAYELGLYWLFLCIWVLHGRQVGGISCFSWRLLSLEKQRQFIYWISVSMPKGDANCWPPRLNITQ